MHELGIAAQRSDTGPPTISTLLGASNTGVEAALPVTHLDGIPTIAMIIKRSPPRSNTSDGLAILATRCGLTGAGKTVRLKSKAAL
jgi:hypothetical protein